MAHVLTGQKRVAIIGAGPGGIVAARYLLAHGFGPVLFERSDSLGGQWNQGADHSGVWPSMVTNTSSVTTQFSDMPWPPDTPMFPHNRDVLGYLQRYAEQFGVAERIRTRCTVERIQRADDGQYAVTFQSEANRRTEKYPYVIVASGRYCAPKLPSVDGMESFAGTVEHAFHYRGPEPYRGRRVLVAGCAISTIEIAPELAMGGAAKVLSCMRRQRYVLQRIVAGTPIDQLLFTRYGVLAKEVLPIETVSRNLKDFIVRTSGVPEQWGGRPADPDPLVAGITQGQFYLPLLSERRIVPKPWIRSVSGKLVTFADDSQEEVDTILFATGFRLSLPFLEGDIRQLIGAEGPALKLYRHTLHPGLPGLAFLGLFHQAGPYFPPLELQARWITYMWAGACRQPGAQEMSNEMAGHAPSEAPLSMNERCVSFARDAGVEPDLEQWPELRRALYFGPLAPVSFRLSGPDALPDAAERFATEAARFGVVGSGELTHQEIEQLRLLQRARTAIPRA